MSLDIVTPLRRINITGRLSAAPFGSRSFRRSNPSMPNELQSLFAGLPVLSIDGPIVGDFTRIEIDSRRVGPGSLYFALPGTQVDGNDFIEEAIDRGAIAVVSEIPANVRTRAAYIQVDSIREVLATVSARFFGHPEQELDLIGITGTNGKTTVAAIVRYLLEKPDAPVGLLGTIQYELGHRTLPAHRTTPESVTLYDMLAQMRAAGCQQAVMEVSSHGIIQKRIWGVPYRVAAFLNLTQDHLDYHGDMEAYFSAKARLFTGVGGGAPEVAVINAGDAYGRRLCKQLGAAVSQLSFGRTGVVDFMIEKEVVGRSGIDLSLKAPCGRYQFRVPLLGAYNADNAVAALAIVYALGEDLAEATTRLERFPGVPGRMERVDTGQPFLAVVDYAHTDDALRNVLDALREVVTGRLLVVFGCGGNRDRTKRSLMTAAVLSRADQVWATADNPRNEDLGQIFSDMQEGVGNSSAITFEPDRRAAIRMAIEEAKEGDCVLVAGKGHEAFQEIAGSVHPFDDRVVLRELLEARHSSLPTS